MRSPIGVAEAGAARVAAGQAGPGDLGQWANDERGLVADHSAMESTNASSRFLLLPELNEPTVSAKQPIVRRYSLARIPVPSSEPPAESHERAAA
ncbi:MAG: hypothetical protein ABSC56_09705 [Solirubrobacteraceae bacterium]|jgi:hypothetical protein